MKISNPLLSGNSRLTAFTVAGLAMAGGAAILLGWLSEEVLEGDTSLFDEYVRGIVHASASPRLTAIMWLFTDLGSVLVTACLLGVTLAIFWLYRWRAAAVTLLVTMAGSAVLEEALKLGFHRQRPAPYFGISEPDSFSYPSGHALFSFAIFVTVAALLSARLRSPWARAAVWSMAAILILLIGLSRIYLGVHYPSDVAAGYLSASVWVLTVSLGNRLYGSAKAAGPVPDTRDEIIRLGTV